MDNKLADRQEIIRQQVQLLITKANQQLQTQLPPLTIRFDLRGKSAGQAIRHNGKYSIRFNRDMIGNSSWEHIRQQTVPHELAHICTYHLFNRGGHGPEWRKICQMLGGQGAKYHREPVIYARGKTFLYTLNDGTSLHISQTIHNRIQQGRQYKTRTGQVINHTCRWVILDHA
jgi:predicted SprT family Zn-dependent metalloprotease